jgi:hypothetical protein
VVQANVMNLLDICMPPGLSIDVLRMDYIFANTFFSPSSSFVFICRARAGRTLASLRNGNEAWIVFAIHAN